MSDSDAWVVDRGLLVLRDQINAAWPTRDKSSDGTIGDAAHAARDSDHNPESPPPAGNPDMQVDALDVTHDPAHGADMGVVSEAIRASRDVRVKYVIFDRRIVYPTSRNGYAAWAWQPHSGSAPPSRNGYAAWAWQPYSGSDPHTNHMHVSVNDVHHDETQPWAIGVDVTDLSYDPNRVPARVGNRSTKLMVAELWTEMHQGVSVYATADAPRGGLIPRLDRIEDAVSAVAPAPATAEEIAAALVADPVFIEAVKFPSAAEIAAELIRQLGAPAQG